MIKPNTYSDEIIELALKQLGKPYMHCYRGPDSFDCAGLVWYIYKELFDIDIFENGYGLSTTTRIMTSSVGILSLDKDNISVGDIILLHRQSLKDNIPKEDNKYPGHCGIYLGDNKFIHCPGRSTSKRQVIISSINDYWYNKLVGSKSYEEEIKKKVLKK